MNTITYHAATSTMGDTTEFQATNFREWAKEQLTAKFPAYDIDVSSEESLVTAYTDDEDARDEIIDYCSRLWDSCPWDWLEYVAISPEGYLYGRGDTEKIAEEIAIKNWNEKWNGNADPVPEFTVKLDDGLYDE